MSSAEEGEETSTSKTNNTTLERRHSDTTQQASNKKSTATTAASLSDDDDADDNNIKRQHQLKKKKNTKKFFGITEVQFRGCSSTRGTSRGEHEHDVIDDVDANTDDLDDNNNNTNDCAGEREVQKVVSSRRIMPAKLYSKRRASLDSVAEDVQATLGDLATTTANNNCLIANQLE